MKKIFFSVIIFIIFILLGIQLWHYSFINTSSDVARIELLGDKVMKIAGSYEEPGFRAFDSLGNDISNKVIIYDNINYYKSGTYEIIYSVTDDLGNFITNTRFVILNLPASIIYQPSYNDISNSVRYWWSGNKKDHTRPTGGFDKELLASYQAAFLGPDEKVIYLTFDEGSNETYVSEIVDILNLNDVRATFFFCRKFILNNPDLMKKIVETGHSVGNHTANHVQMSQYANEEKFSIFLSEIREVEKTFMEVTGKALDKVYRDPKGEWSERGLAIVKDLGYKTFFYSADYLDWNGDVSSDYAYQELMKRYHNGAIYLIHPQNKGNYLALDKFIKDLKNLGYRFGLVKNIVIN